MTKDREYQLISMYLYNKGYVYNVTRHLFVSTKYKCTWTISYLKKYKTLKSIMEWHRSRDCSYGH